MEEPFVSSLKNTDYEIIGSAAFALRKIGSERALQALLFALKDKNAQLRVSAVSALGSMGGDLVIEELRFALNDENGWVRKCAANALGNIGDKNAVDDLIDTLQDQDQYVRESAIFALAKIGDERAVPALGLAISMQKEAEIVKQFVAEALGMIGGEQAESILLKAIKEGYIPIEKRVVIALGKFDSEQGMETLSAALKGEELYTHFSIIKAIDEMINEINKNFASKLLRIAFYDRIPFIRERAVELLARIEDHRAERLLENALNDTDNQVRECAKKALERISFDRSMSKPEPIRTSKEELIWILEHSVDANKHTDLAELTSKIGKEGLVDSFKKALFHKDIWVRQNAIKVLGYYTNSGHLLELLQNWSITECNEEVRTAAREAAEKYANELRYFA